LIEDAASLSAAKKDQRRDDFTSAELAPGAEFFFQQEDNLAGTVVYKLRIIEASADRIVFDVQNAQSVKKFFVTLFGPGDLQSVYVFDRDTADTWRLYSILRVADTASDLIKMKPASAMNRALAFYRHFAGIQTNKEPPAAK
jgi:hypothetical protein